MRLQERKLKNRSSQFGLTVPKKLVIALKWKKGDRIRFEINSRGNLELVKE